MPRIQGGRPGPSDTVFRVFLDPDMSSADIAAAGDALGVYVFYDDHVDGGWLCWFSEATIEATYAGGFDAWWLGVVSVLAGLGASAELAS